jgi:DNA (cytosine-5)-methyltransferase 1
LENVKHLVNHDNGNTYKVIVEHLKALGYILTEHPIIMSPHHIGIPQNRERIFILGIHKDYFDKDYIDIVLPDKNKYPITSMYDVLDARIPNHFEYTVSPYENEVLRAWDVLVRHFKKHNVKICSPMLVDEFGATYDYSEMPKWKQDYCRKNREFYQQNKEYLDTWMLVFDVRSFKKRDRKLEWQAGEAASTIYDTLIQLRQSGIRCKRNTTFPALVAIVQTSIVGKYLRRITPREAARLQSFPEDFKLYKNDAVAYKQLGNSANVKVISYLAKQLLLCGGCVINETKQE